jgi:hypothetical protein
LGVTEGGKWPPDGPGEQVGRRRLMEGSHGRAELVEGRAMSGQAELGEGSLGQVELVEGGAWQAEAPVGKGGRSSGSRKGERESEVERA